jgi:dihydroorotase
MAKFAETPNKPHKGRTLLTNVRILDPETGYDKKGELLIENGKIADFGKLGKVAADKTIDCTGNLLTPGLIDIQVHAREPGFEKKETFLTAGRSAVAGGVTSMVVMPNTKPTIDNLTTADFVSRRARENSLANVYIYGSLTRNLEGKELAEIGSMSDLESVVGITDDGMPLMNSELMRHAFIYAAEFGLLIAQHAEDHSLTNGASMNEGAVSARLGLKGMPNAAEAIMVERDLLLLESVQKDYPDARYHVLHVSTKEALESIKRAKDKGLNVTCETAPHYFTLTDEAVGEYRTFAKMNPPLRSEKDRKAIYEAVVSGLIDAIATDHAPHDQESKRLPFAEASFGIVGLETMLPLSLALYHKKDANLRSLIGQMTHRAADIIRVEKGRIKKGADADLTLIDLDVEWKINPEEFHSKSKNSPFDDYKTKGRAVKTFVGGQLVYEL